MRGSHLPFRALTTHVAAFCVAGCAALVLLGAGCASTDDQNYKVVEEGEPYRPFSTEPRHRGTTQSGGVIEGVQQIIDATSRQDGPVSDASSESADPSRSSEPDSSASAPQVSADPNAAAGDHDPQTASAVEPLDKFITLKQVRESIEQSSDQVQVQVSRAEVQREMSASVVGMSRASWKPIHVGAVDGTVRHQPTYFAGWPHGYPFVSLCPWMMRVNGTAGADQPQDLRTQAIESPFYRGWTDLRNVNDVVVGPVKFAMDMAALPFRAVIFDWPWQGRTTPLHRDPQFPRDPQATPYPDPNFKASFVESSTSETDPANAHPQRDIADADAPVDEPADASADEAAGEDSDL